MNCVANTEGTALTSRVAELEVAEAQLAESKQQLTVLTDRFGDSQTKVAELETELLGVNSSRSDAEGRATTSFGVLSTTEAARAGLAKQLTEVQMQLTSTKEELASQTTTLATVATKRETSEEHGTKLSQDLGEKLAELGAVTAKLQVVDAALLAKETRIAEIESQLDRNIGLVDKLNESLAEERRTTDRTKGQVIQFESKVAELEREAASMQLKLEDASRTQTRSMELQLESADTEELMKQVQAQLEEQIGTNKALETNMADKQERLTAAEKLVAKISVDKLKTKAMLNEAQVALENLNLGNSTLEATAKHTQSEIEQLQKMADRGVELEKELSAMEAQLAAVTSKLSQADLKVSAAEKLVTTVSVEKMKLKAELAELKSD
jgi:chromosome segregation ATPase